MQAFVSSVAAGCTAALTNGEEPVILVGHLAAGGWLRPYRWGDEDWQCPLPAGINIRPGNEATGERAHVYVNDVPVIEFDTPTGDCFVVPRSMVGNLEVLGVNPANAMTMTWERIDDERLNLIVEWTAQLN